MTWTAKDRALFRRLSSPGRIQAFLDGLRLPGRGPGGLPARRRPGAARPLLRRRPLRRRGAAPAGPPAAPHGPAGGARRRPRAGGLPGAAAPTGRWPSPTSWGCASASRSTGPCASWRSPTSTDYFNLAGERTLREYSTLLPLRPASTGSAGRWTPRCRRSSPSGSTRCPTAGSSRRRRSGASSGWTGGPWRAAWSGPGRGRPPGRLMAPRAAPGAPSRRGLAPGGLRRGLRAWIAFSTTC